MVTIIIIIFFIIIEPLVLLEKKVAVVILNHQLRSPRLFVNCIFIKIIFQAFDVFLPYLEYVEICPRVAGWRGVIG